MISRVRNSIVVGSAAGFVAGIVAGALAAALAAFAAGPALAAQTRAFVVASDFSSGTVAGVDLGPPRTPHANLAPICADAVLRWHEGLLYVIERFNCDNIRILDPANNYAVVHQFSVGNGTNPNDIVVVSPTKAYVTRYDSPDLAIVNPSAGTVTGSISLAAFADADGIPEMNRLALRNGRLFVSVQRVDRDFFFTPTDSSQLVVVDVATDALVDCDPFAPGAQGILLPAQNPTTEIETDADGKLVVGCTGAYGVQDGGVARVDPIALVSEGLEVTEATLGGDVNDVALGAAGRGFVVLSDANFNTLCAAYDRTTGARGCTVHASAGFTLADAEVNDRGELWLCDRTPANPGLRVFDAASCAPLVLGPISVGLPPVDVTFDTPSLVGVDDSAAGSPGTGARWSLAGVAPQPFIAAASARFRRAAFGPNPGSPGARNGTARLSIFDSAGRRVRALDLPLEGADELAFRWDGRDEAGRPIPAGVYPFQLEADGGRARGRFVRLGGLQ